MKTSICSKLYEWYLHKRYKKVKEKVVCGVTVQFYWTLKRCQIRNGKIRAPFRRHRVDEELQKEELRQEIRKALMFRIMKKS